MFVPCFVIKYVACPSSFAIILSWLLYFNCLPDVLLLLMFCDSFSRCRGLVCSVIAVFHLLCGGIMFPNSHMF